MKLLKFILFNARKIESFDLETSCCFEEYDIDALQFDLWFNEILDRNPFHFLKQLKFQEFESIDFTLETIRTISDLPQMTKITFVETEWKYYSPASFCSLKSYTLSKNYNIEFDIDYQEPSR